MKAFEFDQYSPQWWDARRGVPTASEFGKIMTAKTLKLSASATEYAIRLIADTYDLTYGPTDEPLSAAMRKGTFAEPESRRFYAMERNCDVQQVGFCMTDDGRFGCSPDGLIGDDGALELKNPSAHTHVGWLLDNAVPDEHKAQVHGHLIVTGRAWCDFLSYCPGFPPLLVRTFPDDYTKKLAACLDEFWTLFKSLHGRVKAMVANEP